MVSAFTITRTEVAAELARRGEVALARQLLPKAAPPVIHEALPGDPFSPAPDDLEAKRRRKRRPEQDLEVSEEALLADVTKQVKKAKRQLLDTANRVQKFYKAPKLAGRNVIRVSYDSTNGRPAIGYGDFLVEVPATFERKDLGRLLGDYRYSPRDKSFYWRSGNTMVYARVGGPNHAPRVQFNIVYVVADEATPTFRFFERNVDEQNLLRVFNKL